MEKILLVEDDVTFSSALVRALRRRGYTVRATATTDDAIAAVEAESPDWIILDLNLGGTSGLGLIPELRNLLPDARIVVLTGYASIGTAVDAIKLGATQYLAKPVDVDALLRAFDHQAPDAADTVRSAVELTPMSIDRMEWEHLQRVLRENQGNVSATARALKMHRRTLQRKLMRLPGKN